MAEIEVLDFSEYALPSRGVLYGGKLPDGKLGIRKLRTREIGILESQGGGMQKLAKIIDAVVKVPAEFKVRDLLMTDRLAILLMARCMSFGSKYSFTYKCRFCNATASSEMNIATDLSEKKWDGSDPARTDIVEPFEHKLPDNGKTLSLRFLRGSDEDEIEKYAKRVKMQSAVDPADPTSKIRLTRQIVKVDGAELNTLMKEHFIESLTARDMISVANKLDSLESGIDLTVYPECAACSGVNKMSLPFDSEFFRPTSV